MDSIFASFFVYPNEGFVLEENHHSNEVNMLKKAFLYIWENNKMIRTKNREIFSFSIISRGEQHIEPKI